LKNKTRAFILNTVFFALCFSLFFFIPSAEIKIFIKRLSRHILGIIGFLFFLVPLNHSKIKQYLKNKGKATGHSLKKLHNIHIYCGCTGFITVLIHTEFNYRGFPGITFYCLILTVATGLLGKFLFTRIPKNIRGEELTQEELRHISHSITESLVSIMGKNGLHNITAQKIRDMSNYISAIRSDDVRGGWFRAISLLIYEDLVISFFRKRKIRKRILQEIPVGWGSRDIVMELIVRKSIVIRNIHFYKTLHELGKYWRQTHKWLQKTTLLLIVIHTAVGIIFFVP